MAQAPKLGFLEPLKTLLSHHGDRLQDKLSGMGTSLAAIRSNTEAQLVRNQFARKSLPVAKKTTGQLRNDSAYGWVVKWVASSAVTVRIYVGTDREESFLCELVPATPGCGHERVEWYVPVGGVVFIKNETETDTYVNFETEVMVSEAAEGYTGDSGEMIEVERREPVPSGTPLDTVQAV